MVTVLKPLNPREEKRLFLGYDIETHDSGRGFLSASIWHSDNRVVFCTEKRLIIEMFKRRWLRNKIIVGTNTAYDWAGTLDSQEEEMEFEMVMRGSRLLTAKTHVTPKGLRKRQEKVGGHHHPDILEFWDTLNFASESVEKIGKLIKIPKLEPPEFLGIKNKIPNVQKEIMIVNPTYEDDGERDTIIAKQDESKEHPKGRLPKTNDEWEQLFVYNVNDAKISMGFMKFMRVFLTKLNAPLRMTIASTAMAWWRANHLEDEYYHPTMEDLLEQFESYYGGRVEVIERGEHFKDRKSVV